MTVNNFFRKFSDVFKGIHKFFVFDPSGCYDEFDNYSSVLVYYGDYDVVDIFNQLNLDNESVLFIFTR